MLVPDPIQREQHTPKKKITEIRCDITEIRFLRRKPNFVSDHWSLSSFSYTATIDRTQGAIISGTHYD